MLENARVIVFFVERLYELFAPRCLEEQFEELANRIGMVLLEEIVNLQRQLGCRSRIPDGLTPGICRRQLRDDQAEFSFAVVVDVDGAQEHKGVVFVEVVNGCGFFSLWPMTAS